MRFSLLKNLHTKETTIKINNGNSIQGLLRLVEFKRFMHQFTLLQYVYGECQLRFIYAIDFSQTVL